MTGRHQMRALGRKSGDDGADDTAMTEVEAGEDTLELAESWTDDEADIAAVPSRSGWIVPALALLAIAGWSGFFGWAQWPAMQAGAAPQLWAGWIVQWAVPVALIGIIWLLAMRSSRAEANRFAASAALMNRESAALEARLKIVNRELSLAREFLAAQSRDLEALGRIAACLGPGLRAEWHLWRVPDDKCRYFLL